MKRLFSALVCVLILCFSVASKREKTDFQNGIRENPLAPITPNSPSITADLAFGKMPVYFIPNEGQLDKSVAYYIQGKDKTVYFAPHGLTIVFSEPATSKNIMHVGGLEQSVSSKKTRAKNRWVVKMDFIGANPSVRPVGREKTGASISYFKGKPEQWKTDLAAYSSVIYPNLWPGIDLVYSGTVNKLKYEFVVNPGADPSKIRLAYRGAAGLAVDKEGRLEIKTPLGNFHDDAPIAYQEIEGKQVGVPLAYSLDEESGNSSPENSRTDEKGLRTCNYGFEIGAYDKTKRLVLDPAILIYCGYVGGASGARGGWIAVDGSGNAYITGDTESTETTFPVTVGPDLTFNGTYDAFVAKVNSSGTALVYCGYIGGSGNTMAGPAIVVDGSGNAYITGSTACTETTFPVTVGPDLTYNGGAFDAFVAKINPSGTALDYCGYIGGAASDRGYGLAVDSSGNAFIAGFTASTESTFPVNSGPDLTYGGGYSDGFVAKVNASGTALDYCGYIGGSGSDYCNQIAVDGSGHAYVTGETGSTEATFPVAVGPDLSYNGGTQDAFVAKVNPSGTALDYCGYIGGNNFDRAFGIALDSAENAYVIGYTASTEATFPVKVGPDLSYNGGTYDAFVAKVNVSGTALDYCGYIGGSGEDRGYGIAVDGSGKVFVAGFTGSDETTFPVKVGPDLSYNGGTYDAFVACMNASGTALIYCGYIGGSGYEYGYGPVLDPSENVYIVGVTSSSEATFPVIAGPDLTYNGSEVGDAFVAKISALKRDDLIGTWDGQGVYFKNSDTGAWTILGSPANLVACGDLDGDGLDDLIGIWPGQGGVWVKYSKTGAWALLSSTARDIAAGNMNGDSRADLVGTWDGQGVFYRDSVSGTWVQLASPADQVKAGDLDGDGIDDIVGIWPGQGGVWSKSSKTGAWALLSSTARDIAAGDMNGDGRVDLVGTWDNQGVYFKDSIGGAWVQLASPADLITTGDLDGDGIDDLIGIWSGQGGVWVKYSTTQTWAYLGSTAGDITSGKMAGGLWTSAINKTLKLQGPQGGYPEGPAGVARSRNLSADGPRGSRFVYQKGTNLAPKADRTGITRTPGPGEPGFSPVQQKNLSPRAQQNKPEKDVKKQK